MRSRPAPAPRPRPRRRAPRRRRAPGAGRAAAGDPARPAQPLENLIGRTLNHRYLVEDKIGEGGFGAVFRGKQIATGREVALKILHPHNVSRRDHRRPLPPRGRGLLEAARPAHRHHLRLRRDAGRHPLPGDGAAARARACTSCRRPRGRCGADARAADPRSGRRVADRGARQRHRPPRHEAGERLHRDRAPARTTSRCSTSASPR